MTYKPTYCYCGVCGHTPQTSKDQPNRVARWWDPDDGWKIGALCDYCYEETRDDKPDPDDYAYHRTNEVADDINTDEDPTEILMDLGD